MKKIYSCRIRIGDGRMREPKEIFINGNTLEKILENHKHWLNKDVDEWKNMCANLSGTDLDKEEQIRKGVKLSDSITGWKKCKDGVMCNDKRIYFAR